MQNTYDMVYQRLLAIYQTHRRRYKKNPDSKQMCCMWSMNNPPDELTGTRPIHDIEKIFDILIEENTAVEMYDMNLD